MLKTLIVDDELFFREAISEIVDGAGYASTSVEDGESALALLEADPEVGVVVLDVQLPGIDGIEVLRRARELRPGLRVIVLSASSDQEVVLEALRLGACDYLVKPLHDEELVLAVGRAAESHTQARDLEGLRDRLALAAARGDELDRLARETEGVERDDLLAQVLVDGAAELVAAAKTSLMLLVEGEEELRVAAAHGRNLAAEDMDRVQLGRGIVGTVAQRGDPVLVCSGEDGHVGAPSRPERYATESFAIVPLSDRHGCFGVLCAADPVDGAFAPPDLVLLRLLAGRAAPALALGREAKAELAPAGHEPDLLAAFASSDLGLSDDAERDSELARSICEALVTEVEPERVLRSVLEPIATGLDAAPVSLYLIDGSGELRCEAQVDGGRRADRSELPRSRGLTGTVLQSGCLVAAADPAADPRFDPEVDTALDSEASPLLCVPIRLRGKVVGLCRVFGGSDEAVSARTGEVLAAALSAAVRNVLLYRSLVDSIEDVAEARRSARG